MNRMRVPAVVTGTVAAGALDLLLCSDHRVAEGEQALAGLAAGYRSGQLSRASARAAVAQILALRGTLPG